MSRHGIDRAFESAEAAYKAQVVKATFGHLDPECDRAYRGAITVAVGCRRQTIIKYVFRGLCDSPLLAMTMDDVFKWIPSRIDGAIYLWIGHLVRYKNGKTKLTRGKVVRCKIVAPVQVEAKRSTQRRKREAIKGHEYLVQGHGPAVPVGNTTTYPKGYEVLDLTENGEVVFTAPTYNECLAWAGI